MLVAEASWSTAKERRGLMELMFEKFGVPAMYPAKNAMLSAFSAGRATALVGWFRVSCSRDRDYGCNVKHSTVYYRSAEQEITQEEI